MTARKSAPHWTPVPYGYMLQGHLTINALKIVVYLGVAWLVGIIVRPAALPFGTLLAYVALSALICAVPQTFVDRSFTIAEQQDTVTNPLSIVIDALCFLVITPIVGVVMHNGLIPIIAVSLVMVVVDLVVEFAMLPRGDNAPMTREDFDEKIEQTRRLTHDIFDDDVERMRDVQQSKLDEINREHGIDKLHHQ